MKILLKALLLVVVLVVIVTGTLYSLARRSLPPLDGAIEVAGLSGRVTIDRDSAGVVTISATDRRDAAFATGFAHGQDRFFQMDLSRRNAAGELAELFGAIAVPLDQYNRLHRFRSRAGIAVTQMTAQEDDYLSSYTAGVNAGLASLRRYPPEYDVLRVAPAPWRNEDTVLVGYSMFKVLNDERAISDVRRGIAQSALPEEVFAWLYPQGTIWDAPIVGDATSTVPMPDASIYDLSNRELSTATASTFYPQQNLAGSNNWAVSGDLTASGRAMVANDMHLSIGVPNTFYRARLIVEGVSDISGVTLPGTPVVVSGSNGKIAWGFTNSNGDWSDAVIVRPGAESGTYETADGPREFERIQETILVKGDEPREIEIRETIWGPIIDNEPFPGTEIAVRWIAHEANAISLNQLQLETANSVEEALALASTFGMPPQNFVCGDVNGNIGWTIAGKIPLRSDYDATLPADWSNGGGWLGWQPAEAYPRVVNPESGRIWTANARVVDGDALAIVGDGGYDIGARASQIRDGLFEVSSFEPADMLAIQTDDRAIFLKRWQKLLVDLLDDDAIAEKPERADFRDLVVNWNPRASVDSVGYRLVRQYRLATRSLVFEMLMAPVRDRYGSDVRLRISNQFEGPLWTLLKEQPAHLLSRDFSDWNELLLRMVDQEIERYASNFADGIENRSWGEKNTAAIRHPLSGALGFLAEYLDMPADQLSGDSNLPKAMGPAFGASERFAVSPGDERSGYLHMPAGQSGHPLSPFYRIGHADWVQGRASPFLPGRAMHTLTLINAR